MYPKIDLFHDRRRPKARDDLLLADHLTCSVYKKGEQIKGASTEFDDRPGFQQPSLGWYQLKWSEPQDRPLELRWTDLAHDDEDRGAIRDLPWAQERATVSIPFRGGPSTRPQYIGMVVVPPLARLPFCFL